MLKKLIAWLEAGGRDSERRKLAKELDELDADEEYIRHRKPQIIERMRLLGQQDSDAQLVAVRHNYVFMSGDRNALLPDLGNRRFYVVEDDACLPRELDGVPR